MTSLATNSIMTLKQHMIYDDVRVAFMTTSKPVLNIYHDITDASANDVTAASKMMLKLVVDFIMTSRRLLHLLVQV